MGCNNPDCATERQMLGCAQRDIADLMHILDATNETMRDWQKMANERIAEVMRLNDQIAGLQAENHRLRAALANSKDPCVYCSLPAEEFAKCQHGFPGCARTDDMSLCPEFGAALDNHYLRQENEDLKAQLAEVRGDLWANTGLTG